MSKRSIHERRVRKAKRPAPGTILRISWTCAPKDNLLSSRFFLMIRSELKTDKSNFFDDEFMGMVEEIKAWPHVLFFWTEY